MSINTEIKKKGRGFKKVLAQKQPIVKNIPAIMGDGNGALRLSGGRVWVRINGIAYKALCTKVAPKYGKSVWVGVAFEGGRESKVYQVLSDNINNATNEALIQQAGYAPSSNYEYGGPDPLYINLRAITFLRLGVSSTGGLNVELYEGKVWTGTDFINIATQDIDLTAHIPSTTGKAAFVMITINTSGNIVQTKGSEVDITALAEADRPAAPAGTAYVSGCIRVYEGQTQFREGQVNSDFDDLRFSDYSSAYDIEMPYIGSPTNKTLRNDFTARGSSGVIDGTLTYVTVGSTAVKISVAAGDGYIRTTNDQQGELKLCHWNVATDLYTFSAPATGQENTIFIGIDYNSGTPAAVAHGSLDWNYYSNFPLARCSYDGTTMRICQTLAHAEDTANLARQRFRFTMPFQREEAPEGSGGLEASSSGAPAARSLAMSAGNIWHGFNRYVLSALASGTVFDTHYRRAGGGFTSTTGVTQWPNTQYDDGSGALATMTASKYACLWIYVDVADGSLDVVYGRGEYTSTTLAQAEARPTTPAHLQYHGKLIARLIFQKSAATPAILESAWTSIFAAGSGGGLSAVEADGSLTGDGSSGSPLSTASGTSTATAAGTTILTVDSTTIQIFTGTNIQTVKMPDVTTLRLGQEFVIINKSTGLVTIRSSGNNAITSVRLGSIAVLKCIALTGTTDTSWATSYEVPPSQVIVLESAVERYPFNARLTLETGVAFSTTAQTAKTVLYLTPYNGDQLSLFDGSSRWQNVNLTSDVSIKATDAQTGTTTNGNKIISGLTDTSQLVVGMQITGTNVGAASVIATIDSATQVTGTVNSTGSASNTMTFKLPASTVYDVFCFNNSATAKLELVAGTATRTVQDGIEVKTGDTTRRLVGTVMTTATAGQLEMSQTYCSISNRYNLLPYGMFACPGYNDNGANTTYTTTSTTFIEANSGAGGTGTGALRLNFVLCKAALVELQMKMTGIENTAGGQVHGAIGIDTITNPNTSCFGPAQMFSPFFDSNKNNGVPLAIGAHYASLLFCGAVAGTTTIYADTGTTRSGASQDSRTTWVQGTILM